MHSLGDEEMRGRAALYALGAMNEGETRAFEEHLAEGCAACASELEGFEEVANSLAFGVPEQSAPARAREKLLSLVAEESRLDSNGSGDARPLTLRADEGKWYAAGEGIFVKPLFTDARNGTITTLVKMLPGTRVPRHRHRGIEQCYIIEGDFHADNQSLGPGDFHCAPEGSVHEPVYTLGGALLLIVAPQGYDLLEQH